VTYLSGATRLHAGAEQDAGVVQIYGMAASEPWDKTLDKGGQVIANRHTEVTTRESTRQLFYLLPAKTIRKAPSRSNNGEM